MKSLFSFIKKQDLLKTIKSAVSYCAKIPASVLLIGTLIVFLPLLEGGTNFPGQLLLILFPLPLALFQFFNGKFYLERLKSWPFAFFTFFVLAVFVSLKFSVSLTFSVASFFNLFSLYLISLIYFLSCNQASFKYLTGVVVLVGVWLSLLSSFYLLPGTNQPFSVMNLTYANYGHNHLAGWLIIAIPLAVALIMEKRNSIDDRLARVFFILLGISFLLTFSRGAFIALPLVLLITFPMFLKKIAHKKTFFLLFVVLPLISFFSIFFVSLSGISKNEIPIIKSDWLKKQVIKPELFAGRDKYYHQAFEAFIDKPFTGYGWGNFEIISSRYKHSNSEWSIFAHNYYLQTLSEAGFFALLFFLTFLLSSLGRLLTYIKGEGKRDFLFMAGVAAVLASSLHSLVDYDWHFPVVLLVFLLLLVNLLAIAENQKDISPSKDAKHYLILIFVALVPFLYGLNLLMGEYYWQKSDYPRASRFFPPTSYRATQIGEKLYLLGDERSQKYASFILSISPEDQTVHEWLSRRALRNGELGQSAFHTSKVIELNPVSNYRLYTELISLYDKLGWETEKDKFYLWLNGYLINEDNLPVNLGLAKNLYTLGLKQIQIGRGIEALTLWQKAIVLAPEWSYFHLELASLNYQIGNEDEARQILIRCLERKYPADHCRFYLGEVGTNLRLEKVGAWQEKINEIPN